MPNKILIVEDDRPSARMLGYTLEKEGFQVMLATNGVEALKKVREEAPDLVVLDVMLPGKNGFDVCRDLRQKGFSTPILMLTARGQVPDKVVGLKLGADDYLTKPFEMMELLAGQRGAAVLDEVTKQLELEGRELDRLSSARYLRPPKVDLHVSKAVRSRGHGRASR